MESEPVETQKEKFFKNIPIIRPIMFQNFAKKEFMQAEMNPTLKKKKAYLEKSKIGQLSWKVGHRKYYDSFKNLSAKIVSKCIVKE